MGQEEKTWRDISGSDWRGTQESSQSDTRCSSNGRCYEMVQEREARLKKLERKCSKYKTSAEIYKEKFEASKALWKDLERRNNIAMHRLQEISTPDELLMRKINEIKDLLDGDISKWVK